MRESEKKKERERERERGGGEEGGKSLKAQGFVEKRRNCVAGKGLWCHVSECTRCSSQER
jgi:hypothetical protein